jgi:predicted adenylyl cyclase CyaB
MQVETEVKIKYPNYKKVERQIKKLGAKYLGQVHQKDIYYSPAKGPRFTAPHPYRFRLRICGRPPTESRLELHITKTDTVAHEYEVEVSDHQTVQKILELLGYKITGIIEKERIKYKYKKFNITFDLVKNLGNLMEVELMGRKAKENERKIYQFIEDLGIKKDFITVERYLDMLLRAKIFK